MRRRPPRGPGGLLPTASAIPPLPSPVPLLLWLPPLTPPSPLLGAHSHAQALTPVRGQGRDMQIRLSGGLKTTWFLTAETVRAAVSDRCVSALIHAHVGRGGFAAQAPPDTSWGHRGLQPGLEPALLTTPGFWDPGPTLPFVPRRPPGAHCCDSTASLRGALKGCCPHPLPAPLALSFWPSTCPSAHATEPSRGPHPAAQRATLESSRPPLPQARTQPKRCEGARSTSHADSLPSFQG